MYTYTCLVPSPSYAKREKESGEKGRTTVSLWNAIINWRFGVH